MPRLQCKRHRGAAAVEFALVLVPLLAIVMGAIDYGYYFYLREVVTNAAREGARIGSTAFGSDAERCDAAAAGASAYLRLAGLAAKGTEHVGHDCVGLAEPPTPACCVRVDYPSGSVTGLLPTAAVPAFASAQAHMRLE